MFRKMYQGGPSRKQGPRLAIRDADNEPPREAQVRACEWPSEDFMDRAGIKEEFNSMCVMLILRASRRLSAASNTISLIPLGEGLNFYHHAILKLSFLIFMKILILWT